MHPCWIKVLISKKKKNLTDLSNRYRLIIDIPRNSYSVAIIFIFILYAFMHIAMFYVTFFQLQMFKPGRK